MLRYSLIDRLIINLDSGLRTLFPSKADKIAYPRVIKSNSRELIPAERIAVIQMLRVNHAGEVCAQALYHGQAISCRSIEQYNALMQAAVEEGVHLSWCRQRLEDLGGRRSILDPLWYSGSLAIGFIVGLRSDAFSLGFVAETEHQVTAHLERHLMRLPEVDLQTRVIFEQMRTDELQHATNAIQAGGIDLSELSKFAMKITAKVMTNLSAWC